MTATGLARRAPGTGNCYFCGGTDRAGDIDVGELEASSANQVNVNSLGAGGVIGSKASSIDKCVTQPLLSNGGRLFCVC
jgi:hypothetical protein